jgi:hypothetical protein
LVAGPYPKLYWLTMSDLTVEVDIDHGRVVAAKPGELPEKGKGLLTVLEAPEKEGNIEKMTPLEAFHALQKSLNLDTAKAKAWMEMIRDARR